MSAAVPKHLSREGRALWRRISGEFEVSDGAAQALLQAACEACDRVASARRAIGKDLVVFDRYHQRKPHPLLATERDARAALVSALKALRLAPSEP